ncbi:MAG: hypothetical protein AB8C46_12400 [Burkholderiaceae bacterium]
MKFQRAWDMNYNGGVIRFTPEGESEQLVIWETANMTTQQHSGSATFSAPTVDGRQAWMTISTDGQIIGGGVHGNTQESYLRCGVARNGVATVGIEELTWQCRSGIYRDEDGNASLPGTPRYTPETPVTIKFDFSVYPFKSIQAEPYIPETFGYDDLYARSNDDTVIDGRAANQYFYRSSSGSWSLIIQDGELVLLKELRPSPAVVIDTECGKF